MRKKDAEAEKTWVKILLLIIGLLLGAALCLWLGYKAGERQERERWNKLLNIGEVDIPEQDIEKVTAMVYSLPDDSDNVWVEEWTYLEYDLAYELESEFKTILLKAHSQKGSSETLFGVGDIVVTDAETGEQSCFNLSGKTVKIACLQGNFLNGDTKECGYEILELR